jgi:hypothetical protein
MKQNIFFRTTLLLISASVNGSTIEDGGESKGDMWADSRESDFFDDEN